MPVITRSTAATLVSSARCFAFAIYLSHEPVRPELRRCDPRSGALSVPAAPRCKVKREAAPMPSPT
jgi:hypothetical protein